MSCLILMSPASHLRNPALQDSYRIFNQDCDLVSQLPKCVKAQIERSVSARVKKMLSGKMSFENNLADEPIIDPIENIRKCGGYMGYYKEKVYNV